MALCTRNAMNGIFKYDTHYSFLKVEMKGLYERTILMNFRCNLKAQFTLLRSCTETERKDSVFVKMFHTDLHKNATKTEVFENVVKSGYPKKRRFLKTL